MYFNDLFDSNLFDTFFPKDQNFGVLINFACYRGPVKASNNRRWEEVSKRSKWLDDIIVICERLCSTILHIFGMGLSIYSRQNSIFCG